MTLLPSSDMKLRNQVCWIARTANFFAHNLTASGSFTVKFVFVIATVSCVFSRCGMAALFVHEEYPKTLYTDRLNEGSHTP